MTAPRFPAPERFEWVEGSALVRSDLAGAVAAESAFLELHTRGLHGTWGIALGLTPLLAADGRSVLVTPGYALTRSGTAIVSSDPQLLGLPGVAGAKVPEAWDLVLQVPARAGGCIQATTCDGERPALRAAVEWVPAGPITAGQQPLGGSSTVDTRVAVVVARFLKLPSGALTGPDFEMRRTVRVAERPHIASGTAAPGSIDWTAENGRLMGTIDTTAAGFSSAPVYRVWFRTRPTWPKGVVCGFLSVVKAGTRSIRVELALAGDHQAPAITASVADTVSLAWMGVEPVRGSPPAFTLARVKTAFGTAIDLTPWAAQLASFPGFTP